MTNQEQISPEQSNNASLPPIVEGALAVGGLALAGAAYVGKNLASGIRYYPKTAALVYTSLLLGAQAQENYNIEQPDSCTDYSHEQVYVPTWNNSLPDAVEAAIERMPGFAETYIDRQIGVSGHDLSWNDVISRVETARGYTITLTGLEDANTDANIFEYDEAGNLEQTIKTDEALCVALPAPSVYGFENTDTNDTLESLARETLVPLETLVTLNPQLANAESSETDTAAPIAEGDTVKINDAYDTSLILRPSNGNLIDESNGDVDLRTRLAMANVVTFTTGESITDGDDAFLAPLQTPWMTEHDMTIEQVIAEYDADGAYTDMTIAPEVVIAAPEAPVPEVATLALNEAQNQIIDSLGRDPERTQFIRDLVTATMNLRAEGYTMNPEVMVSQAIVESNWGFSDLSASHNNFFGMKAPAGTPLENIAAYPTQEFENGQYVWVDAHFLHFNSVEEGLRGYIQFVGDRTYFADALDYPDDVHQYVSHLQDGDLRWATSPTYVETIETVVNDNRLTDIFAAATTNPVA